VLVTAGGTREPIDGVRFVGNRSSGRMGYALAEAALGRGARVILISAPTSLAAPGGAEYVPVNTAEEMRGAVLAALPCATMVLKAAAVADFRPRRVEPGKLPRAGGWTLELEPTGDIVAEVVERRLPGTLVIAFAAEMPADGTSAAVRGREKMRRKGVDAMVVNDVSGQATGFDSEENAGVMLVGEEEVVLPRMTKRAMAERILDQAAGLRRLSAAGVKA
jgi:phosphopantothenoylcysteine decarboxylase/phosphopantothenate--cysteine ligase